MSTSLPLTTGLPDDLSKTLSTAARPSVIGGGLLFRPAMSAVSEAPTRAVRVHEASPELADARCYTPQTPTPNSPSSPYRVSLGRDVSVAAEVAFLPCQSPPFPDAMDPELGHSDRLRPWRKTPQRAVGTSLYSFRRPSINTMSHGDRRRLCREATNDHAPEFDGRFLRGTKKALQLLH